MKPANNVQKRYTVLFLVTAILLSASTSLAHKVNVFAYGEGGMVNVKSYFSDGKAARHSALTVADSVSGQILLQAETDKDGLFEFSVPSIARRHRMDLHIEVNTGEGHRAEWLLPADEYLENEVAHDETSVVSSKINNEEQTILSPLKPHISCDEETVSRIVENALDRKLAPLKAMLQHSRNAGPDFRNILGGIGYIIGLAGIAAYVKSRKKKI